MQQPQQPQYASQSLPIYNPQAMAQQNFPLKVNQNQRLIDELILKRLAQNTEMEQPFSP